MGLIIYDGMTQLPGQTGRVVAILTGNSTNKKTGPMAQLWILVGATSPVHAAREGRDAAVCGNCVHRPANRGSCYVLLHQAPSAVWHNYAAGRYLKATKSLMRAEFPPYTRVRLGAYGDPMALPIDVVESIAAHFDGHTGYTHQWMHAGADRERWQRLVMASVDSPAGLAKAQREGWRTFRVRTAAEELLGDERVCPAADEAELAIPRITCEHCMQCSGGTCGTSPSVAIIVHGSKNRISGFNRIAHE